MALTFVPKTPGGPDTGTPPSAKYVQNSCVLGLDISSHCGVAILDGAGKLTLSTIHFDTNLQIEKNLAKKEKRKPNPDALPFHQFNRWAKYEAALEAVLGMADPELIVIEGYGFASQSLGDLVELGTHLKRMLWRKGYPWVELTPNGLKKFCTGKGAGPKDVIMMEAYKRFGIDTQDNNQTDAAVLAYAGAALLGWECVPKLPQNHLDALKGLKVPACN